MNITGINKTDAANSAYMNTGQQDSFERNIMKQIADVQEKLRKVSENKELSVEQKMSQKKELQDDLQNLNNELKNHQIQKRREATAKKQENPKQENTKQAATVDEQNMGVLVTLSTAKEQMNGLMKIKTDLEGKLRTSRSEEEKIELQNKIDNISKSIAEKVKKTEDTISDQAEPEKAKSEQEISHEAISEEDKQEIDRI